MSRLAMAGLVLFVGCGGSAALKRAAEPQPATQLQPAAELERAIDRA
jgi:fructoselysine-6-P-deglycase FrlB-like protein